MKAALQEEIITLPYRRIRLVNERGFALVDEEDYALVQPYHWNLMQHERADGSLNGYARTTIRDEDGRQVVLLMHQLLIGGSSPRRHIDHINDDGLDNRRRNLQYLSPNLNILRSKRVRSATGFRGVYKVQSPPGLKKPYWAYITIKGKRQSLGLFTTAKEASFTYEQARATVLVEEGIL